NEVQRHPKARVFSFGIGNSVNRFLLDKMAEQGRGEAEYVFLNRGDQKDAKAAADAAKRFYERVRAPLLTDISVDWNGWPVADVYPNRPPDLFSAKPLFITGRYTGAASGAIRLRGKTAGGEFQREIQIDLPETEPRHDALASLWARTRIDDLMAQDYRGLQAGDARRDVEEEITRLGLDYRLMTQFTSFIAVSDVVTAPGEAPRRAEVPVAAPNGTMMNAVGAVNESVVITSSASALNTSSAEIAATIERRSLDDLPLNMRQATEGAKLAPGGAPTGAVTSGGLRARPEPIINESGVSVTLNGADLDNDVTGGTLSAPPLAALNEMSVTTFGVRADQDRAAAAVRLTTKSGSNAWSGSASFSRRGDQLSALPATFERGGAAPSFDRAQFSGAIGGPIVKDRAFWFGSFEQLRQRSLLQAGERDLGARTIRNKLSAIPLA